VVRCRQVAHHTWDAEAKASTRRVPDNVGRRGPGPGRRGATHRLAVPPPRGRGAPSATLAATGWVGHDVYIPGLPEVSDDACSRAMDWLVSVEPTVARTVDDSVVDLLDLKADLPFFDAAPTYVVTDEADEADDAAWRDGRAVSSPRAATRPQQPRPARPPTRNAGAVVR
jgi:hypothetical protein